jgi:DNA-binding protein HU-beta
VKKTSVPAFRPGASFKDLVAAGRVPKATKAAAPAKKAAPAKAVKATTVRKAAPAKKATR